MVRMVVAVASEALLTVWACWSASCAMDDRVRAVSCMRETFSVTVLMAEVTVVRKLADNPVDG